MGKYAAACLPIHKASFSALAFLGHFMRCPMHTYIVNIIFGWLRIPISANGWTIYRSTIASDWPKVFFWVCSGNQRFREKKETIVRIHDLDTERHHKWQVSIQNMYITTKTLTGLFSIFWAMVVLELLKWRAPPVLILLVVLLAANTKVPQTHDVQFVEMFAGDGAVSMALWEAGLLGSSHDVRYNKLMDLLTPHGFAFFGINIIAVINVSDVRNVLNSSNGLWFVCLLLVCFAYDIGVPYLRLAVNEIWNCSPGALCLFGICCNSFSRMWLSWSFCDCWVFVNSWLMTTESCQMHPLRSSHTAGRDCFNNFLGNQGFTFVQMGNILCSRVVLMLFLCSCKGCRWVVEQPEGSSLSSHPRFQELLAYVRVPWPNLLKWCHFS